MSQRDVRVGCLVRFLNAVGGGRVSRITKDTAWVEDPDGFEMPTPLSECVVVEEGDSFVPAYKPPVLSRPKGSQSAGGGAVSPKANLPQDTERSIAEALRHQSATPSSASLASQEPRLREPHSFVPASGEVNAALAILPVDELRLGNTPYEVYLINDSKYSIYYVYSVGVGDRWDLRGHGLLLPERDLLLEEVESTDISHLERINVQLVAIADNPGIYKGTYSVELRLDPRRLLRVNSFEDNDYFTDRALVLELVNAGATPKAVVPITKEAVIQALDRTAPEKARDSHHSSHAPASSRPRPEDPIVTDLHLEHWLDDTSGMSPLDMLRYQMTKFNEVMQRHASKTGSKLIFIHGKGGGILRTEIMRELSRRYPHCHSQDASFVEYGHGATLVIVGNTKSGKKHR